MTDEPRGGPQRPVVPATGTADPRRTEIAPEEEPSTPGTLFLCVIILMIIAGYWIIIYLRLLDR